METPNYRVEWNGRYEQFGSWHTMKFSDMKYNKSGRLWGAGKDDVGEFTINGEIKPDLQITFDKQYIGQHMVQYKGNMTKDNKITGTWGIPGQKHLNGNFEMKKSVGQAI